MDKKFSVGILLIITIVTLSYSQLSESFDNTTFPPEGWRIINNDGENTWLRNTSTYNTPPGCAACFYNEYVNLTNDDWLVTPRLFVTSGDSLKFYYRSVEPYLESLEVRLSFKGPTVSNFTRIIWARRFNNTSYALAKIPLHPYVDSTIYIAFRDLTPLGDMRYGIYLDDISGSAVYSAHDVGVTQILAPIDINIDSVVLPSVRVKNFGSYQETIPVVFKIDGTSYEKLDTTIILPGADTVVHFPSCTLSSGSYNTISYTLLTSDDDRTNDTCKSNFILRTTNVWQELTQFPKEVKTTGTSLCYDDNNYIYCLRASDTSFYAYNLTTSTWERKRGIPIKPKSGLGLAYGNNDTIYTLTRNKKNFYKYSISGNNWQLAESMPVKLKTSTGFCSYGDYIYCLPGDTTFLRYSNALNTWERVKGIPVKMKPGSALISDTFGFLYALRGTKKEFYRYSVSGNNWEVIESIPIKKVKKGVGLATDGFNIYCMPSGKTKKFFRYNPVTKWQELDSTPEIIKGGGAITAAQGFVYCLPGSKTQSFLRYIPEPTILSAEAKIISVLGGNINTQEFITTETQSNKRLTEDFLNLPLWLCDSVVFFFSEPKTNKPFTAKIEQGQKIYVYNSLGRFVTTLKTTDDILKPLSWKNLSSGIYFICSENQNGLSVKPRKLVIIK